MADDLEKLPYTIKLSRKALAIIKQNILLALGLKILALLLIIPGLLTLWMAILADMGATLIVIINSLRLLKVRK
jgi:Cd2+/Zn2+-exporting ATPase